MSNCLANSVNTVIEKIGKCENYENWSSNTTRHIERFKKLFQEKVLWRKPVSKQKHTLYFKSINGVEN